MIVPMKKVSVLTLKAHETESLTELRNLGVLHIFTQPGESDNGDALREQYASIERTLTLIPVSDEEDATGNDTDQALELAEVVQERADEKSLLLDELERLRREVDRFGPWGDPMPEMVESLARSGVHIRLYEETPDRAEDVIAALPNPIVLSRTKTLVRIVSVALTGDVFPDQPLPLELPGQSMTSMKQRIQEIEGRITEIDSYFQSLSPRRHVLEAALAELEGDLEFVRIAGTFDSEGEISWITGFAPEDIVDTVKEAASAHGWGLAIRDPEEDEQVPTKISNPKPVAIIKPVFDLLGTVPGYREMDISFFFLLFFVVFFAMIIGDGGYGVILLAGTVFFAVKGKAAGKQPGPGTALMMVLSLATVIWGAITGNWFGYAPFADLPVLNTLVIPGISAENESSTEIIQYMCFVIGTVHLSIAHIWNFFRQIRQRPRVAALAQLGWLTMVLGLYYLVLQLVLDPQEYPMPGYALYMIGGGLAAVIMFGEQKEGSGFLAGVGRGVAGLITTALDGISAFSDIISYIRLFAVGLASLAIAEAFNAMAGSISTGLGGAGGAVAAALVLFLGHTLNLAMGALSVVVHGVRLNMLEFSGHLGMEWTGVEYSPFKTR
jgi:V/A-type H+/Na+-transporting ATPase subunit I